MNSNDVIKEEPREDQPHLSLDNTSVAGTVNPSPGSPHSVETELKSVNPEPQSTEGDHSARSGRLSPAPVPNALTELEMKPIFVPSPWPTYLTLPQRLYDNFVSARDINYTPQAALEQALLMVKAIEACIQQLNMHTELRRIMWRKKLSELKTYNHGFITIAICGGTGAGKSTLINAVLDAYILPTSDSRACTSAVVEVRYHRHPFFSAEVEFITYEEWEKELEGISDDVHSKLSPDGAPDFDSEFTAYEGASWQKASEVYPSLTRETLVSTTPDEIIRSNADTACLLGTTKKIEARTPSEFRNAIAAYMASGTGNRSAPNAPRLWPLVRKVTVYTKSAALESGSRLVDLPGTGDVNEARNNVAKGYLSEADYIWIVAPIKRAADERAANDLIGETLKTQLRLDNKYDQKHIAFIATATDNVSEREIIESLGLEQDQDLLELQAEIVRTNEALKQIEKEAPHTQAMGLEISSLKERRTKLKRQKKQKLAKKRNENMKKVIQQKFRTGLVEPEPNSTQDDSGARVLTNAIDSDSSGVQVFTCSSYDYTNINLEDDEPTCFTQVEDTEIPRLQHYCYDLALPAQKKPILQIYQELEKFLYRLREYAGADNGQNYADRLTLANKWESDIPSVTEQLSFLSILNGSSVAGSRQAPERPESSDEPRKPTLESVVRQATKPNAENLSTRGFSYEVRQAMEIVIKDCVKHLKQELRGALEDLLLRGVNEAKAKALATHDLFAPRITHWATYRATLRRNGEFKRNLNEELVAPITRHILEVWPTVFAKPLLAPMARDAKLQFESILSQVAQSSTLALRAKCERQCHYALQEAQNTINEIETGLKKLIIRKQRKLSRSLAPAIKYVLGPAYREAIEIRGRKSTELQKNLFRGHVDTLRQTMFTDSVMRLLEELDSISDSIGLILSVALGEVACQAEVNLAALWHMPKLSKEEVEKRKEFIREANNELGQVGLWLTRIPTL